MSDGPAPAPWPASAPPVPPPSTGLIGRVAMVLAGLALLGYLVAGILVAIPVSVPEVQSCGSPAAYLLAGRLDVVPDGEGRILDEDGEVITLDPDVASAARAQPCRDRVADRATPAAILLTAATALGLVAFVVELGLVRPAQRRALHR